MIGTKTRQLLDQATAAGKPLQRRTFDSRGYGRRTPDSQRSKLYRAEQVVRTGPQLSPREVNELVLKIRTSAYVLRNYGDPGHIRVNITGRRTRTSAAFWQTGEIRLAAAWGCSADVIVHEVAHMYASPAGDPGHDWLFCHIYLDFVRKFIGAGEAAKLKASFKKNKIRFAPPRKRKAMSPAQKAAASDRMAKARAARQQDSIEPHTIVVPQMQFGEQAWGMIKGSSIPKGGWLKTTRAVSRRGYANPQMFTRKTAKGIEKALTQVRTWPGADKAMAIPVSQLPLDGNGFLPRDWDPTSLRQAATR